MDIPCPVFPEFQESQCLVLLECLESLCPRAMHARNHRGGSTWILIFLPTPESFAQKIIMAGAFAPATITISISRGISD